MGIRKTKRWQLPHPVEWITPQTIADELHMTTHYLSDLLQHTIGQKAQQLIHTIIIDRAKTMLSATNLSAQEIAYALGFEYPQYFTDYLNKRLA